LSALQGGAPDENRHLVEKLLQGQGAEAHAAAVAINVALLLRLYLQLATYCTFNL
jgi:anthranilate phosphoribosyltransferase